MDYIRIYKKSQTLLVKGHTALQTLFNGFWLGVLSYQNLHKIDELYYDAAESYYSVDYNKKGLSDWEQEMIEKYFQNYHNLLLIGAGGGREVYGLQKMGYSVDAFECNSKLMDFGNKFLADEGLTSCIKHLERDQIPETTNKYDGIIIGWGVYMSIQGSNRRINFLKKLRSLIKDDGRILLSFLTRKSDSWEIKNTIMIGNIFRFLMRREYLQIGDSLDATYIHCFNENELSNELKASGYNVLYYGKKTYGHAVAEAK